MKSSHSILVAYGRDGFRSALDVVEALEAIAEVQLCSYEQSQEPFPHEPDVALCVITDEESIGQAHDFQVRLDDVPTVVVDGSGALKIEVNGYAGSTSSSPDQVLETVGRLLAEGERRDVRPIRKANSRSRSRPISSPFDHTLARSAGGEQTPRAVLIAAARQLSWDLRAFRSEGFLRMVETNGFRKVYAEPEASEEDNACVSPEVVRLIKRRPYPVTLQDLEAISARPLYNYLASRHLNLLIPLVKEARLLGWLAFRLESSRCTDELLDDLQIAGYLLTTCVAEAFDRELKNFEAASLFEAFLALRFGILTVDKEGQIVAVSGTTALLGSKPQQGDHFKSVHNSRAREVIAHGLRGNFIERSWLDLESQSTISCFSAKLADGKIVVFWGPQQNPSRAMPQRHVDLKEVLDALPVPVLVDNELSPDIAAVPQARISNADCQAIKECALQAQAKNVKSLRLRCGKKGSSDNAVLFYESDTHQTGAEFSDAIKHAVRFSFIAA